MRTHLALVLNHFLRLLAKACCLLLSSCRCDIQHACWTTARTRLTNKPWGGNCQDPRACAYWGPLARLRCVVLHPRLLLLPRLDLRPRQVLLLPLDPPLPLGPAAARTVLTKTNCSVRLVFSRCRNRNTYRFHCPYRVDCVALGLFAQE